MKGKKIERTYLKLALCNSLPPSAAGTLPLRELPLRFLFTKTIKYHYLQVLRNSKENCSIILQYL